METGTAPETASTSALATRFSIHLSGELTEVIEGQQARYSLRTVRTETSDYPRLAVQLRKEGDNAWDVPRVSLFAVTRLENFERVIGSWTLMPWSADGSGTFLRVFHDGHQLEVRVDQGTLEVTGQDGDRISGTIHLSGTVAYSLLFGGQPLGDGNAPRIDVDAEFEAAREAF